MSILKKLMNGAAGFMGQGSFADFQKRAGLYVMRPVINGQRWYDWAVKAGVPNPVPADRMHVTIVYSRTDVQCRPESGMLEQGTNRVVLRRLGPDGGVLVAMWDDWCLSDRHQWFRENGATSDWAGYRVHMTLSYGAGEYEIPEEMLAELPELIILGGEVHSPLNEDSVTDLKKSAPVGQHVPDAADIKMGAAALAFAIEKSVGTPIERAVFRDLAKGRTISDADVDEIAKAEWAAPLMEQPVVAHGDQREEVVIARANDMLKAAILDPTVDSETVGTLASIAAGEDVPVLKISALPMEMIDKLAGFIAAPRELLKGDGLQVDDAERRIAWGWASVSTVKGTTLTDLHKHEITTGALYDLCHGLIKGQRAGDFNHSREWSNEIVEAMVFCKARQEALGIDLGKEGVLISMHVPDDNNWELVKSGEWMFSIDARGTLVTTEE